MTHCNLPIQNIDPAGILGLILAGGNSTRLGGGDKTLRPLGSNPILHQVCTRLQTQTPQIVISANSDPILFSSTPYPVIHDGEWHSSGPLAGILAGCRYAQSNGFTHVLSVAADTPFFPKNLRLNFTKAQAETQADIIFARSQTGAHPTFALWPVTLADELENWLRETGRRSIRVFAASRTFAYADFNKPDNESGLDPFFNINTRHDLEQARFAWSLAQQEYQQ